MVEPRGRDLVPDAGLGTSVFGFLLPSRTGRAR